MSAARISTAWIGSPMSYRSMLAGSKLTLRLGAFSSSRVRRSRSADSWPVSKARVTPFSAAIRPARARVSSIAGRSGWSTSGRNPAWRVRSDRPSCDGPVEGPGQAVEPLGPGGGVAEAAGGPDRLGRGVVLAREPEHGAGEGQAGSEGGLGHGVAFGPARVVGVAAGDLGRRRRRGRRGGALSSSMLPTWRLQEQTPRARAGGADQFGHGGTFEGGSRVQEVHRSSARS